MRGTFKPGDKLCIENISYLQIKKGDAIVFNIINKSESDFIVHRVVDITSKGLVTRGDNNPQNDKSLVSKESINGRVIHFERNGKNYKVFNGKLGILRTRALYGRLHMIRAVKFFLRKPYLAIKKSGIVAKFWRPEIEIIYFETRDGPLIKYVHRSKTVAFCWVEGNYWWYRRPYDLVISNIYKKEK